MSKKIISTEEPRENLEAVPDFLSRTEELVSQIQGGKERVMCGWKSPQD
jgi:hypothetical protein